MSSSTAVPARPAQREAVAQVLLRAFATDPLVTWAFDRPRWQQGARRRFFRWYVDQLIDQDVTWTTSAVEGAALWALPNQWRASPLQEARLGLSVAAGVRWPIATVRGITSVEAAHPKEPHLYLAMLGVDPSVQGKGLGSVLISAGLEVADEERWPAYLETATERNLAFYGRHGFDIVGRLDMPRGGPPVWRLWREPR